MTKVTQLSLNEGGRRRIHLREISTESEEKLETVGQDLRTARLRRGEDLATVSRALKIRKEHLEAVEEDRIENLPGKTYALGFVRTYAAYLGLDVPAMVQRFKEENSGRHDGHRPSISPVPDDERHLPRGWRLIAAMVLLLLAYGAWHLLSNGPPPEGVPPAPMLNSPKTAAAKPFTPASQAAQSSAPTTAASTATPASPPAATAAPAQPADAASAASGTGQVYGDQKDARVVLKAESDTRLTVKGEDGATYLNRDLKPGDSFLVPNAPGVYLATSNAGALEVDLDGKALGRMGQNQEVLGRVSLDPQSLADRFNAH